MFRGVYPFEDHRDRIPRSGPHHQKSLEASVGTEYDSANPQYARKSFFPVFPPHLALRPDRSFETRRHILAVLTRPVHGPVGEEMRTCTKKPERIRKVS